MMRKDVSILLAWMVLYPPFFGGTAFSEMFHQHVPSKAAHDQAVEAKTTDVSLLDLALVDQDGRQTLFKSEVVGDKLVVINFVYTTCKTACPIQSAIFEHLQEALGDRLGKEVFLVSLTLDPATDIPERLKAFANKYHSKPGWSWLTGKKLNVDQVLVGVGAYSSDIVEHPSMILIGDGRNGGWTRFYGFPGMEKLLSKIDELQTLRNAKTNM